MTEAALWLESRGEPLWSVDEPRADRLPHDVKVGLCVVAEGSGSLVAVARLSGEDRETWPDAELGEALYVHRLAVVRSHSGGVVSERLIRWCRDCACQRGVSRLRLDCDARRVRLRSLYEKWGFRFHSEAIVGQYIGCPLRA